MIYQGMPQDGDHVRIVSPRPFPLFRIRDNSGQWQTPLFSSLLRHPHFLGDNSGLSQSTASPRWRHSYFLDFPAPHGMAGQHFGSPCGVDGHASNLCGQEETRTGARKGKSQGCVQEPVSSPVGGSIQFGRVANNLEASKTSGRNPIAFGFARVEAPAGRPVHRKRHNSARESRTRGNMSESATMPESTQQAYPRSRFNSAANT